MLHQRMQRIAKLTNLGEMAIGQVDNAFWDLAGRTLNIPVYKLLGAARTKVLAYASTMPGDDIPGGLSTIEEYQAFAEQLVAQGYRAIKLHTWMPPIIPEPDVKREAALCAGVREAVGPDIDLMLDAHHHYDRQEALYLARECQRLGYVWIEEPMNESLPASAPRVLQPVRLRAAGAGLQRGCRLAAYQDHAAVRAHPRRASAAAGRHAHAERGRAVAARLRAPGAQPLPALAVARRDGARRVGHAAAGLTAGGNGRADRAAGADAGAGRLGAAGVGGPGGRQAPENRRLRLRFSPILTWPWMSPVARRHPSTRQVMQLLAGMDPDLAVPAERLRPLGDGRWELKVVIDAPCQRGLEQLKGLLSHVDPHLTLGALVGRLVQEGLARHDPSRPRPGGNRSRPARAELTSPAKSEAKAHADTGPRVTSAAKPSAPAGTAGRHRHFAGEVPPEAARRRSFASEVFRCTRSHPPSARGRSRRPAGRQTARVAARRRSLQLPRSGDRTALYLTASAADRPHRAVRTGRQR